MDLVLHIVLALILAGLLIGLILRLRKERTLFGLVLGLVVWYILILEVWVFRDMNLQDVPMHLHGATGFAASCLGAFIAKRRGIVIGCATGFFHVMAFISFDLYWMGSTTTLDEVAESFVFSAAAYLLPSILGGLLGEGIALVKLRRSTPQ